MKRVGRVRNLQCAGIADVVLCHKRNHRGVAVPAARCNFVAAEVKEWVWEQGAHFLQQLW